MIKPPKEHLAQRLIRLAAGGESAEGVVVKGDQNKTGELGATPLEQFGMTLGAQRRKKKLDLEELAELTGIDEDTLMKIELGAEPLERVSESIPAIAQALGLRPKRLDLFLAKLMLMK